MRSQAGEEPQHDGEQGKDAVFGEEWMEIRCPCWRCGAKETMGCSGVWRALASMRVACLSKRPWKPPKGVPAASLPGDMVLSLETEPLSWCSMAPAPLHSSSRRGGKGFLSSHKPRGQGGGQTRTRQEDLMGAMEFTMFFLQNVLKNSTPAF